MISVASYLAFFTSLRHKITRIVGTAIIFKVP